MKRTILTLSLALTTLFASAQDIDKCKETADKIFHSFQPNSAEWIDGILADDFLFSGISRTEISRQLFLGIFSRPKGIPEESIRFDNAEEKDGKLTLTYYHGMQDLEKGKCLATFTFNDRNQLTYTEWGAYHAEEKVVSATQANAGSIPPVSNVRCEKSGHLLVVKAQVDGEERRFIFDTGAAMTVLNSAVAGSDVDGNATLNTAIGQGNAMRTVGVKHLGELSFCGATISDHDFLTRDINQNHEGQEIYGILGCDILRQFDILIDYDHDMLQLINPSYTSRILDALTSGFEPHEIPFTLDNHLPVITGRVGDVEVPMHLDCGAEANIFNEKNADLARQLKVTKTLTASDGDSERETKFGTADLTIGGQTYTDLPTSLLDLPNEQVLLGIPFLSDHKLLLCYSQNKLVILEKK